jgi:hypothetical protein
MDALTIALTKPILFNIDNKHTIVLFATDSKRGWDVRWVYLPIEKVKTLINPKSRTGIDYESYYCFGHINYDQVSYSTMKGILALDKKDNFPLLRKKIANHIKELSR